MQSLIWLNEKCGQGNIVQQSTYPSLEQYPTSSSFGSFSGLNENISQSTSVISFSSEVQSWKSKFLNHGTMPTVCFVE